MKITSLVLLLALAFVMAPAALPASAQDQGQETTPVNFTGNWTVSATGTKFRSGTYELKQVNQTIIGTNANGAQMNGTVDADGNVEGTWRAPSGDSGWLTLQMAPDRKSFSGQYGYHGRKPEGKLIGSKSSP